MSDFPIHSMDSAPQGAKAILEKAKIKFGFVPNFMAVAAEAPVALQAYSDLENNFDNSTLSELERKVILLTVSDENHCDFCKRAHSEAIKMLGQDGDKVVAAIQKKKPIDDKRLSSLIQFVRAVVTGRGEVDKNTLNAFFEAGFTRKQALEVMVGVSMKTLSNYINHIAETPLNEELKESA